MDDSTKTTLSNAAKKIARFAARITAAAIGDTAKTIADYTVSPTPTKTIALEIETLDGITHRFETDPMMLKALGDDALRAAVRAAPKAG